MKKTLLTFIFTSTILFGFTQNNRIIDFPYYSQNSDIPNQKNDCGPWAVGSILAYWNDHPYLCLSKFDRFINGSSDWISNQDNIRVLIENLKDALPYGNWLIDTLTNPNGLGNSIENYTNDKSYYSTNYNFICKSIVLNALNFQSSWELIKSEIDNGRPVLMLIVGKCDLYRKWRSQWESLPKLIHYMPILGYDENIDGKKVIEVNYMNDVVGSEYRYFIDMESIDPSFWPTTIWTLEPGKKEIDPPQIINVQYTNEISSKIELTFNEKINTSTLNSNNIIIQSESGIKSFNLDTSKLPKLIITPLNLKYNERVSVTLTTGIQNCEGDALDGDNNGTTGPNYSFNFTTGNFSHDYAVNLISLSKLNPIVGDVIIVSGSVKNEGLSTESANQRVFLYDNDILQPGYFTITSPLSTGQEYNVQLNWIAKEGPHNLKLQVQLTGDENSLNDEKSISVFPGIEGNLTIDGSQNSVVNLTLSPGNSVDGTLQLGNIGTATINATLNKGGEIANWITLIQGNSISIPRTSNVAYSYRISVPSNITTYRVYSGYITFTYENNKSATVQILIQLVPYDPGFFRSTLSSASVLIDGSNSNQDIIQQNVEYLDNDPATSYPTDFHNIYSFDPGVYNRINYAKWGLTAQEIKGTASLLSSIPEGSGFMEYPNTISGIQNDILGWLVTGQNTFYLGFNVLVINAANVSWKIGLGNSSINIQYSKAGWGASCPISPINTIKDGLDYCRIYFKVNDVQTPGTLILCNSGIGSVAATRYVVSSDVGKELYFTINSSKFKESNYFSIKGDPDNDTKLHISNIRLEIKYFKGDPNLFCTKSLSKNLANVNEDITVNLSFRNIGDNIADEPRYNDTPLPSGIILASGSLSGDPNDVKPGNTNNASYTIRPQVPGIYTFGANTVTYKDYSDNEYSTKFNAVTLTVNGGSLGVSGQVTPNEILTGETLNISANVTESITHLPVNDATVSCSIKNVTKNILYPPFYLIYNADSGKYTNTFNDTGEDGILEIQINAQKQNFEEGNLSSAMNCTVTYPPYINVLPMSQSVSSVAGLVIYQVNSNVDWQISEKEDWLSCSKLSNSQLQVNYIDNYGLSNRSGTITLTSSKISVILTLSQENCHVIAPEIGIITQPTCTVATGTITVTAPTGTGMTYSIDGSDYTNTNAIFTLVPSGTYTVTARNADECTSPGTSVTIKTQPPTPDAPTATATLQPTCTVATGTITVTAPTGTGMTYSIDGSDYTNTNAIFTLVPSGTYTVTARNADECTSPGTSVTIKTQPPTPDAPTATATLQPTCTVATGTITVTAPTGTGMTYSIDGSDYTNTNAIFTLVPSGTYTVTARNADECTSPGTSVTIKTQPPTPDAPTATATLQPTCTVATGTITVTAPTGTGMTYSIDGSDYTNTNAIFTLVPSGTYTVTARNADECTSPGTSVTIKTQPPTPDAPTATATLQPTCTVATGTITVTAPTGTGMTYSIDGSDYTNTNAIFTLVPSGTYTVTARNADECTSPGTSVTIKTQPPTPDAPTATATLQPTCTVATGTITVTAPTGTGMTYSIDGSDYTNTNAIFTLVPSGTYTVTARNADECTSPGTSVTIKTQPPTPDAPTATATLQPTCTVATGTITVTAPTGTGMTYSIDGSDYTNTNAIFTLVPSGTYTVTARNADECTSPGTSVTIKTQPPTPDAPTATATLQPTCTVATGTITVTAPTGTGMTYSIDGSDYTNTNAIFTLVPSGTYTVTARNADECTSPGTSVTIKTQAQKPQKPTISLKEGNTLHSDALIGNQWHNKLIGKIYGATHQEYIVTISGDYYTIVTIDGCISDTSDKMYVNIPDVGLELTKSNKNIKVYPNPVTNGLIIEFTGNTEILDFEILNSLGMLVFKGKLVEKVIVPTANFNPDVYIIKLENGKTNKFIKIQK